MDFTYHLPVNLIFGAGKAALIGEETAKYGKHALIVTGFTSTKKSGLLDRAMQQLEKSGVQYTLFDKVAQNPLTTTVEEGAALALEQGCDVILGLGGGSIMDAAKGIAFQCSNPGDISDYIYGKKFGPTALPLVLVPTTCGTGSEGNHFAVLTHPETKDKKSLRTGAIFAKASIIDPTLMMTMPKHIAASVGFDALCHCMEAYTSRITSPLVEIQALYAIELLAKNLRRMVEDPTDLEAFTAVSLASTIGGMSIGVAGVTLAHGMEHPASGLRDIVHGLGLAALTPVIIERSIEGAPEKYARMAQLLGGKDETDCADCIRKLLADIGMETTLGKLGIQMEDVDWMTENCLKVSAAGIQYNPVIFTKEEIADIYRACI